MIPVKPNSELIYDQVYLAYRDDCGVISFRIFQYAGLFSKEFVNETIVHTGSTYHDVDLAKMVENSLIFKLTKDEVLTHVILENLAENI